jgi:hypothetical protein
MQATSGSDFKIARIFLSLEGSPLAVEPKAEILEFF